MIELKVEKNGLTRNGGSPHESVTIENCFFCNQVAVAVLPAVMRRTGIIDRERLFIHIDADKQIIPVGPVDDIGMHGDAVYAVHIQHALKECLYFSCQS